MCVIKGLKLKTIISNGVMDDWGRDSDTYYTNSLDSNAVDEFPEITFKITTFDNKNPNYSSPSYYDSDGKLVDVKYLSHKSMFYIENNSGSVSGGNDLVAEELLIQRIVNQYKKPRVVFDYNLRNEGHMMYGLFKDSVINDRIYVMDNMSIDYMNDEVVANLVEKG